MMRDNFYTCRVGTCIAPPPHHLDCLDSPYRNVPATGAEPHKFDGDHDGVGCES
jgi:hypothetical protein